MNNEDMAWLDTKQREDIKSEQDKAWALKELQDRLESARIQCTKYQESTNEWRYARSKVTELEDRIYVLNNG